MADPPTGPVPPLLKRLCNGGNEWPPWPAHLQIFNRFLQSFDQTMITSDFGGELMLFVRGREVVGEGEGNLGRMKDGEMTWQRITHRAFIWCVPPPPPTSTESSLQNPSTHTHAHTCTCVSDQMKLKADGAGPGLCVVSDCHGALTMIPR